MNKQTQTVSVEEQLVKYMVDRFLGWKLPHFHPDGGITYQPIPNHTACGTNLFCAQEAEEMIRYMLEGSPLHSLATEEKNERLLLCLEDREKTIREQTQYIEAIRGAAGMGFNEFHEAIATKRGITLSDSK